MPYIIVAGWTGEFYPPPRCGLSPSWVRAIPSVNLIHLFIVSPAKVASPMQPSPMKIRIIRDKLSRIGIRENNLNDEALLALYSINQFGNVYMLPRSS